MRSLVSGAYILSLRSGEAYYSDEVFWGLVFAILENTLMFNVSVAVLPIVNVNFSLNDAR